METAVAEKPDQYSLTQANHWPRGSEWRKWDLHVHSPASEGFSGDWNQFIIQLGNADCDVIGINDYFSVSGYREVLRRIHEPGAETEGNKAYRAALDLLREKTLFPVVECRMTNVVIGKSKKGSPRVNFHLIFSNQIDVADVERFIRGLKVKGKSIGERYNDSKFLLNDVSVDFHQVVHELKDDKTFEGQFLVWIPYDEHGGIDDIDPVADKLLKEGLIYEADVLGSSSKKQAEFFLWEDQKYSHQQYREWFGKRKPCIKGSDSHSVNDELGKLKDHRSKPTNKYCWIKADPTFNGLCQIVHEPAERVYVGAKPPKLEEVSQNRTRFISAIEIRKAEDASIEDEWFDCAFPVNHDMVAIIGDKGTGKSALADVLGLLGNTHCDPAYFSFLNKERFCEKNGRIAKNYVATLTWEDKSTTTLDLNQKPNTEDVELLKYIPQSYLEKICTETTSGEASEFQSELRKVIFSHIGEHERLGQRSLEDLISYKSEEIRQQIESQKLEVRSLNSAIVRLEEKASERYRKEIEGKLVLKKRELMAHDQSKPKPVEKPQNIDKEQKSALEEIEAKLTEEREKLRKIEDEISTAQSRRDQLTTQSATAEKLSTRLKTLQLHLDEFVSSNRSEFEELGLDIDAIVRFQIDETTLSEKSQGLADSLEEVRAALDPESDSGLQKSQDNLQASIGSLGDALDLPNKQYQEYVEASDQWERRRNEIVGDENQDGSLENLKHQLDEIKNEVPIELSNLKSQRTNVARTIHKNIATIRHVYDDLFAPVQNLIEEGILSQQGFNLQFASSIVDHSFSSRFFDHYINQGVAGSFCGKERGAALLDSLMEECDFNNEDESIAFVENVVRHLGNDLRTSKTQTMEVASQLRKKVELGDLYDYLWCFGYVEPEYALTLDGKDLAQLSPGERGTLLLVFYLLVDRSRAPIVVDQPEENLDSKTVYRLLIPVIKEIKKRRQVIMVTHSPNIAVVCDAEQVIHAEIDRAEKNRVSYEIGSIESEQMNKYLIDVLEGTRPAFENREAKYLPGI